LSRWDGDTTARPGGCQGSLSSGRGVRRAPVSPDVPEDAARHTSARRPRSGRGRARSAFPATVPNGAPLERIVTPSGETARGALAGKGRRADLFGRALVRGGGRPVIWPSGLTGGWTAGVSDRSLFHILAGDLCAPGSPVMRRVLRLGVARRALTAEILPPGPGRPEERGRPAGMTPGEKPSGALPDRREGSLGRSPVFSIECRASRNLARPLSVQPRRRRGAAEDLLGGGGGTERCRADGAGSG
jgi:hypothetical protein